MGTTKRISFYDNLKFILIVLVVIGHFNLIRVGLHVSSALYLFIYSFHMPLFVFITGYLAKRLTNKDGSFRIDKMFGFLLLYAIFEIINFLILRIIPVEGVSLLFFSEGDCPWYLFAVAMWYPITFVFRKIKPKYLFIGSIILSLYIGYEKCVGDIFVLSRIIYFYPFFLLGFYLSRERMDKLVNKLHNKKTIILSILFLIFVFVIFYVFKDQLFFLVRMFTGQNPYAYVEIPYDIPMAGLIFRMLGYVLAVAMSLAVMALVPVKKTFFTKFGSRTMSVYVLHVFVCLFISRSVLHFYLDNFFGQFVWIFYICFSILLSFIFSLKIFEYPFKKILNLKYDKIFVK